MSWGRENASRQASRAIETANLKLALSNLQNKNYKTNGKAKRNGKQQQPAKQKRREIQNKMCIESEAKKFSYFASKMQKFFNMQKS